MTNSEAIQILKQYLDMDSEVKSEYLEAQRIAIKALEQRWIPVSERLPEKQITIGKYVFSEYVLGTEGYTIRRAYYNYTTKEWFDGNEEMEWTEITHWMPLPEETPKVESEDAE